MAFGQQKAQRVQETSLNIGQEWTALQGTTVLPRRFAVEVYNRSNRKLFLSYSNTQNIRAAKALGGAEGKVEPAESALTLYGRAASSTIRVMVTEYGH